MGNYRDLEVWQKSRLLTSAAYRLSAGFPRNEWFGLVQQTRRAALSVPCNVAEGHGRRSAADRIHFLVIARGSLFELETQALIAVDLEFVDERAAHEFVGRVNEVARLINGLIRHYARSLR